MPDFVSRGYFPKELPPCFVSSDLLTQQPTLPEKKAAVCESTTITLPQANGSRRILTLPNPKGHLPLVKELQDNWTTIEGLLRGLKVSQSRPVVDLFGRVVLQEADLPATRLSTRRCGRYLLRLDITDFYRSVYTHALPWAIHGRALAKTKKTDPGLLGNRLDKAAGLASSNETHGIPVGPITSLVLAEILLTPIDEFIGSLGASGAHRFFDDFELSFADQSQASIALQKIESKLSEYRLSVNPLKTRVDRLPVPIEHAWLRSLRQFRLDSGPSGKISSTNLDDYFDSACEMARLEAGDRVLPYAVGRIQKLLRSARDGWPRIEQFLLHLLFAAPEVTPNIVSTFVQARRIGLAIDSLALGTALNQVVANGVPRSDSLEVIWALWALASFGLELEPSARLAVSNSTHTVSKLVAASPELGGSRLDPFTIKFGNDPWSTDEWLLAHELRRRNETGTLKPDAFFEQIRDVEFVAAIPEIVQDDDEGDPLFTGHFEGSADDGYDEDEDEDEDEDD